MDDAVNDRTNILITDSAEKKKHIDTVAQMFKHADLNGDGVLQKHEFNILFHDPCVEAFFKHLGLDYEAWEPDSLFELIDWDNSSAICIDEFVYACSVLKGQAQRLDLARAFDQQRAINTELFTGLSAPIEQCLNVIKRQHQDIAALRIELNKVSHPGTRTIKRKDEKETTSGTVTKLGL